MVAMTTAKKNAFTQSSFATPARTTPASEPTAAPAKPVAMRVDQAQGARLINAYADTATMDETSVTARNHKYEVGSDIGSDDQGERRGDAVQPIEDAASNIH